MANIRRELPRGYWCETRDPWEITERDLKGIRPERVRNTATTGNVAGTPPQLAVVRDDEEDDLDDESTARAWRNIAKVVVAWGGGPILDDKPVSVETGVTLPLPLRNGIFRAFGAFWTEVSGEVPTQTP